MLIYAGDYDEKWPTADKWCDLLIEHGKDKNAVEKWLKCPANKNGRSHYAINDSSPRSNLRKVLLFETKAGWNQVGGPELLTTDNHNGKGCNVLFNYNTVEFVKTEEHANLKWKDEKNIK
jgi:hypothetical protein